MKFAPEHGRRSESLWSCNSLRLGRLALRALAPRSGESALDMGCGGGETALYPTRQSHQTAAVLAFAKIGESMLGRMGRSDLPDVVNAMRHSSAATAP